MSGQIIIDVCDVGPAFSIAGYMPTKNMEPDHIQQYKCSVSTLVFGGTDPGKIASLGGKTLEHLVGADTKLGNVETQVRAAASNLASIQDESARHSLQGDLNQARILLKSAWGEYLRVAFAHYFAKGYRDAAAQNAALVAQPYNVAIRDARTGEIVRKLGKDYHAVASAYGERRADFDALISEISTADMHQNGAAVNGFYNEAFSAYHKTTSRRGGFAARGIIDRLKRDRIEEARRASGIMPTAAEASVPDLAGSTIPYGEGRGAGMLAAIRNGGKAPAAEESASEIGDEGATIPYKEGRGSDMLAAIRNQDAAGESRGGKTMEISTEEALKLAEKPAHGKGGKPANELDAAREAPAATPAQDAPGQEYGEGPKQYAGANNPSDTVDAGIEQPAPEPVSTEMIVTEEPDLSAVVEEPAVRSESAGNVEDALNDPDSVLPMPDEGPKEYGAEEPAEEAPSEPAKPERKYSRRRSRLDRYSKRTRKDDGKSEISTTRKIADIAALAAMLGYSAATAIQAYVTEFVGPDSIINTSAEFLKNGIDFWANLF